MNFAKFLRTPFLTEHHQWLFPEYDNSQDASSIVTKHSKIEETASSNIGGHQKNMKIISVISSIEKTIKALKSFRKN